MTSPRTARRGLRAAGARAADIVISVIAGDSTVTALYGPCTRRERVAGVEERRVHAHASAAVDALGGPDQLQPEAEVARVLDVVGGDVLDALVADVVEVDRRVERQPGEDRHLRRGVLAGDVVGRVGLGVAEPLRVGQRVGVGRRPSRAISVRM